MRLSYEQEDLGVLSRLTDVRDPTLVHLIPLTIILKGMMVIRYLQRTEVVCTSLFRILLQGS